MTQFHLFIYEELTQSASGDLIIVPFFMPVIMNPENMELSPKKTSALQALALSNMGEGIGQHVTRAQGLQKELAQRRASLSKESAEAQALQGKEALLAEIVDVEMAHRTQVSVLSHLQL